MLYTSWKEITKNSGPIIRKTANLRKTLQFDKAKNFISRLPILH